MYNRQYPDPPPPPPLPCVPSHPRYRNPLNVPDRSCGHSCVPPQTSRLQKSSRSSGDKLGSAFAGILLMVSLHLLEGSKGDSRGGERCQHISDLVETYGRISGTGDDDDDDDDEDGTGERESLKP